MTDAGQECGTVTKEQYRVLTGNESGSGSLGRGAFDGGEDKEVPTNLGQRNALLEAAGDDLRQHRARLLRVDSSLRRRRGGKRSVAGNQSADHREERHGEQQ